MNKINYLIRRVYQKSGIPLLYFKIFRKNDVIIYKGKRLKLFYHTYNKTFFNERKIEIPIAKEVLKNKKDILEIGNVLSHYIKINHDVIDKYEIGKGVINEDISEYKFNKKYDLIISISTFEHIGDKEKDIGNERLIRAFNNVMNNLKENGILLITFPIGNNKYLENYVKENDFKIDTYNYFNLKGESKFLLVAEYTNTLETSKPKGKGK